MMDWNHMIQECAPQVGLSTMLAIIRTESNFNPFAININGRAKLARQPHSSNEASGWAQWLITRGYSVDLGLMQINSANLPRLGLNAATVFDPCRNLQAGANILTQNYNRAASQSDNSHTALLKAISAYNTGNFERGFRNGYVSRVVRSPVAAPQIKQYTPPLLISGRVREKPVAKVKKKATIMTASPYHVKNNQQKMRNLSAEATPYTATSEIKGFHNKTK